MSSRQSSLRKVIKSVIRENRETDDSVNVETKSLRYFETILANIRQQLKHDA